MQTTSGYAQCKVTAKKNGYKEQVVAVAVNDGEMGDLNVELSRNERINPTRVGLVIFAREESTI